MTEIEIHAIFASLVSEILDEINRIEDSVIQVNLRKIVSKHVKQMSEIILPTK